MKIFIAGGAGFGGSSLAGTLLGRGHEITVMDVRSPAEVETVRPLSDKPGFRYLWKASFDVAPEDVAGHDVVAAFNAQADVPLGLSSPAYTMMLNVMGLVPLLEAARKAGCRKFLIPSTGNIFGRPPKLPIDETCAPTPHNPYTASKVAQEALALSYWRAYGVPVVILRNNIVYGEGVGKHTFFHIWLRNLLEGKPIIVEGGDQTRDPCYVSDTIAAWVLALEAPEGKVAGEIFQISPGKEYKVQDIAELCTKLVPGEIIKVDYRAGEKGQRECFDVSKARNILGYNPKVGLEEGLARTKEWLQKTLVSHETRRSSGFSSLGNA